MPRLGLRFLFGFAAVPALADGAYKSSTQCDDVAYTCQLFYNWATSAGQHTATFRSYDWLGNVSSTTVTFTVA